MFLPIHEGNFVDEQTISIEYIASDDAGNFKQWANSKDLIDQLSANF